MSNGRTLATVLVAGLLVTSGCTQLLQSGPAEFAAEPALVAESTAAEQGYALNGTRNVTLNRTLSAAGVEQRVVVTNRVATYEKSLDLGPLGSQKLGVVGVVSSPAVEVAGRSLNPIGDWDSGRLVRAIGSRYDAVSDVERAGEARNVTVLGVDARVTPFEGTTTVAGQPVDVTLQVTRVRHEGDYVVVVGAYPSRLDGERGSVFEMLRNVVHPATTTAA